MPTSGMFSLQALTPCLAAKGCRPTFIPNFAWDLPSRSHPSHLMFRRIILWIHSHIKALGVTWEALYTGKGRPDSLCALLKAGQFMYSQHVENLLTSRVEIDMAGDWYW